ncbi:MAG: glycogen/starch/alpha-glucan family phosphorylase, partial [Acidobacteria bacterium]|nr:glycogen/starch/alpha-glucan family phosphorylase [Acidobacteriota bacterium]
MDDASGPRRATAERPRAGRSAAALRQGILDNLYFVLGRFREVATPNDLYMALAYTVRDRLMARWLDSGRTYFHKRSRTAVYLSAEYLLGPHLANNLMALGLTEPVREALADLGLELDVLLEVEEEPGLGNGGLGRLAACFLDSLSTLEVPTLAYGIRYEFGIFDQEIRDGWQVEVTDPWLRYGNPWEIRRPDVAYEVGFGGAVESWRDETGAERRRWRPERSVRGVAYDTSIAGHGVGNASLLRLFSAEAAKAFDIGAFNQGDFYGAVDAQARSGALTKVLYPNDETEAGRELRLEQQYFFVACALADLLRIFDQRSADAARFGDKYAVQLNDTHPSLAVPELMRLLIDERGLGWDAAWEVTRRTFSYTNHTLLPEALERWPVELFERLLPRHLEIVYEINRRFLGEVRVAFPGDEERARRMSLIEEEGSRAVRMAHLATVGAHTVNGVARLHGELLRRETLSDFAELWPERFTAVTNGVTPRRFLALANPRLAALVDRAIGESWRRDLDELAALEPFARDAGFRDEWRRAKLDAKAALALVLERRDLPSLDVTSLLDVQVKRIHEYKRQHLAALHALRSWRRLRRGEGDELAPRTLLFAGKAAPGYRMAKLIVKLIHSIAAGIAADPLARDRLRVVFVPDYNVKNSLPIFAAAELSEQISTAGKEASG